MWQQKKNIPKDSDNWLPSANVAVEIVSFLTVAYLKSIYCMKEFRVAQALDKLLVVVCEPMQTIRTVDPGQYPHALAYLLGGGQVIFHDVDDVVGEIVKFSRAKWRRVSRSRSPRRSLMRVSSGSHPKLLHRSLGALGRLQIYKTRALEPTLAGLQNPSVGTDFRVRKMCPHFRSS